MKIDIMDLNKLKTFCTVFDKKGISQASKELSVTSSAVSISIINLEKDLKTKLFTRVGKKFVATPAGEKLYQSSSQLLLGLSQTVAELRQDQSLVRGRIRIGAPVGFGSSRLIQVSGLFQKKYPDVSFVFRLGTPDKLLPLLSQGEVDIAITNLPPNQPQGSPFVGQDLFKSSLKLTLVCSKEFYNDNISEPINPSSLAKLNHIALFGSTAMITAWYKKNFNLNTAINFGMFIDNTYGALFAIKNNLGMGLLPLSVIAEQIKSGQLVEVPCPETKAIPFNLQLIQLKEKVPAFAERTYINFLKTELPHSTASI